jgi:GNAT superfamily N-acetyltransferase
MPEDPPMQASAVQIQAVAPDSPEARWCLDQYFRDLAARFDAGFDPQNAARLSDAEIAPPTGALLIARLDERPVGCGALRVIDATTGEVKRMWVRADARRRGIARRILEELEGLARARGVRTLRLDSNRALTEAHALYRKLGYVEVAPFNDEPYAHYWFAKSFD